MSPLPLSNPDHADRRPLSREGAEAGPLAAPLADLRHVLGVVSRDIDSMTRNLEGTSRNMLEFSRQLRANPAVLITGTGGEE